MTLISLNLLIQNNIKIHCTNRVQTVQQIYEIARLLTTDVKRLGLVFLNG